MTEIDPSCSHDLDVATVEDYRQKGYLPLRAVFDQATVETFRRESDRVFGDPKISHPDNLRAQCRPALNGGQIVDRLDPVIDLSEAFRQAANSPVLLGAVSTLLGEEARLFKDKLIVKPAGAHGYSIHQDFTLYQELEVPAEALITVCVGIDDAHAANGATFFYPGLHHEHYQESGSPNQVFNPKSGVVPDAVLEGHERDQMDLRAGDALCFSSLVPHGSEPNATDQPRRQFYFSYAPARYGDLYRRFYELFHAYLRRDRGHPDSAYYS